MPSLPEFEEGYSIWKEAFDQGRAGVWTGSLAECITALEQGMNPKT